MAIIQCLKGGLHAKNFFVILNLRLSRVHIIFLRIFLLHYFLQKTRLVSTVNCIPLAASACGQKRARFVWRHSRNAEPHLWVQTYGRSATVSDRCSDSYDLRLSCWLFSLESDKWEASETGSWSRSGETLPAWAESKWYRDRQWWVWIVSPASPLRGWLVRLGCGDDERLYSKDW